MCGMKVDEVREKFGREVTNDEGHSVWEPNPNKVRGMIMKHARVCDEITGSSDEPDVEHYIDDLWEWLQQKLGGGFEGLFQGDEMSPSGRFDRIGKDNLKGFTENLYKKNDDYRSLVNEKWTVVHSTGDDASDGGDDNVVGEGVTGDLAALSEMGHDDKILEFFVLTEEPGPGLRGKKKAPAVGMYKHYMTEYAIQVNGIPSSQSEPSAEAFVDEWIEWLKEFIFNTEKCIVSYEADKYNDMFVCPMKADVVEWARELWQKNELFRRNVKEKWGGSYKDTDVNNDSGSSLSKIKRPEMRSKKKRKGQVKLGDYA